MQMPIFSQFQKDVVDVIIKMGKKNETVIITYKDSKGEVTRREVEPYEIKDGGLYAYCTEKGSIRFFKLERIIHALPTRKKFTPRWPIKL